MSESAYTILVVCLGNVCRSPLAERLLVVRLGELLGDRAGDARVSSAGLVAMVGQGMDEQAAAELVRRGGDPGGFVARQVNGAMVDEADLVLTATRAIRSRVLEEAPRALKRTFTLLELASIVQSDGFWDERPHSAGELVARAAAWRGAANVGEFDVPDPIGRSDAVHREVADLVDQACTAVARAIAEVDLAISHGR